MPIDIINIIVYTVNIKRTKLNQQEAAIMSFHLFILILGAGTFARLMFRVVDLIEARR